MKKLLSMAFVFIMTAAFTVASSSVFAENASTTVSSTASSDSANSAVNAKEFEVRKTKILQHISDRLAKVQEIQTCVQAATNFKELRDCKAHKNK